MLSYDRLIIRMQYTKYAGEESMVNGVVLWHGTARHVVVHIMLIHTIRYGTVRYYTMMYW
jgi:hypothetical protein